MTITVALADDQEMIRAGLNLVLSAEADIVVVGEAADGAALIEVVARTDPDVALVDVQMPGLDGLSAAERIIAAHGRTKVVMLTTFEEDRFLAEALRLGVSGFVIKVSAPERLIAAIRAAAAGDSLIDPEMTRRVMARLAPAGGRVTHVDMLTDREREVLGLLGRGLSNAEIGAALFVSEHTVKTHVHRVLAKLGLRDRAQAVVWAYEHGYVRPGVS